MRLNKRGVALLQVLIIAAVLAGLSTLILRVVLSRTLTARQTRQTVKAQLLIENCMAHVNNYWMSKSDEAYARDLKECCFAWDEENNGCSGEDRWNSETANVIGNSFTCPKIGGYTVTAQIGQAPGLDDNDDTTNPERIPCQITYTIQNGVNTL